MTNKLNSKQISSLLEALIYTPHWYGETNADNESLEAIETWGDTAYVALQKLTDALDSTSRAPRTNGSSIEIRDAVREQIDVLEEIIQEGD
ncbi:hypothetical protein LJ555_11690 [Lacticaseibacillus paracasei]|uniref:hypothetical protein n=1 Tax=Lacticaseibacillus paracasei TaxID=1597 RepID=UPI00039FFAAC|nr:hypothetical protein [Lacticaseibacillus paracasei]MCT3362077.1 hypothetical protein [Lacticaseibacillus paracasei]UNG77814.1 hypothetical protein LJ555_11690 [Lacticaseibacillus paracasei]